MVLVCSYSGIGRLDFQSLLVRLIFFFVIQEFEGIRQLVRGWGYFGSRSRKSKVWELSGLGFKFGFVLFYVLLWVYQFFGVFRFCMFEIKVVGQIIFQVFFGFEGVLLCDVFYKNICVNIEE